jgi:acetate---CoA ligase (ADP-forming)
MTRSGSTVHVRAVSPDDQARLADFYHSLSERARNLRFGAVVNDDFLTRAAHRFAMLKEAEGVGLVATEREGQRVIAHAMYLRTGADRAEVAFAVNDDRQELGLGTLLLGELAQIASGHGIREFEALVLPENRRMLAVFRDAGFPIRTRATPRVLRYWKEGPRTEAILLYLESFGNPRKFSRIAREVARTKPIVAVKSGRSPAGARAAGSHTGALLAASDVTVDALFRQAGVIRTDTLEEMFDVALLLATQPLPQGRRVGILTNAGGPGILCADTCTADGLEVAAIAGDTRAALRDFLPAEASITNPVDMLASAAAEQYRKAIGILGRDPGVDALVVIFIPPLVTRAEDVARAIVDGARELAGSKPVLTVFMQSRGAPAELQAEDVRLPSYAFPESAARALAQVARYGAWRSRPAVPWAGFGDTRRSDAAALISSVLARGAGWLDPPEVRELLSCYGLDTLEQRVVSTPEEAARAAEELGREVALKGLAAGLTHKTEAGAVRLNLRPEDVEQAAREMSARLWSAGHSPSGFLVQPMAPRGVEMIVGVVHDRQFGPVLACGMGGVLVELVKDVSVRLSPLSEQDAREMVAELRTAPLLAGYRGEPAHDVGALVQAILRVGAMVEDLPQIAELDLNPIVVHPNGAVVVDARVRVAEADPDPLIGSLPSPPG